MIAPEILDALEQAGCTAEQILAAIRADQHRLAVRRMVRRALRGIGKTVAPAAPESGFIAPKADSGVPISEAAGVRMAPVKSAARSGLLSALALRPGAKLVGARLVEHLNLKTGRCDPGIPRMARDLWLSERTVRRSIVELVDARLVIRDVHAGRGHSNAYRLDLEAMAALATPLGQKPDSEQKRTLVAGKPDSRVRLNRVQKQSFQPPRAKPPDRQQPQMLLVIPNRGEIAASSARRRIHADIAAEAERSAGGFNVSRLSERDWSDADYAETRKPGQGIELIRARLATGPPGLERSG
jgi:hypothetical protein